MLFNADNELETKLRECLTLARPEYWLFKHRSTRESIRLVSLGNLFFKF